MSAVRCWIISVQFHLCWPKPWYRGSWNSEEEKIILPKRFASAGTVHTKLNGTVGVK